MLGATLNQYIYPIFYEVQQCIREMYTWCSNVATAIFGSSGAWSSLKVLVAIGIAVSIIYVVILLIKKVVWGN